MSKERYAQIADRYDRIFTTQRWWNKLVWGFQDTAYTGKLLSLLPDDFSGKLLDIPAGTALFTKEKYARMSNAEIICMDYSAAMMENARRKFSGGEFQHVTCMQGDVGNLPFADSAFDMVLSMNGFHAFPDREAAFRETERVLKRGGMFVGCCYVEGERKRTDCFVKYFYTPMGWFTPPFQRKEDLLSSLQKRYESVNLWNTGSIVCFQGIKKQAGERTITKKQN
jgi:ubiquinone/menaquinone biosynthesis C-methylase UbiE